jgi:hypothetical protein
MAKPVRVLVALALLPHDLHARKAFGQVLLHLVVEIDPVERERPEPSRYGVPHV